MATIKPSKAAFEKQIREENAAMKKKIKKALDEDPSRTHGEIEMITEHGTYQMAYLDPTPMEVCLSKMDDIRWHLSKYAHALHAAPTGSQALELIDKISVWGDKLKRTKQEIEALNAYNPKDVLAEILEDTLGFINYIKQDFGEDVDDSNLEKRIISYNLKNK